MFDPKENLYPLASGVDVAKSSDTKDASRYYSMLHGHFNLLTCSGADTFP